jgi:hypothetical protein
VSEAVIRKWDICTADISKAFLQGVTYAELSELTGEAPREVNFYLPANNIPLLRQVEGFQDFNPLLEVLHCDKPGTGLVDAPRAFSMKLREVTTQKCKLVPCNVDNELMLRHDNGILTCMMTKHVDDLKITGEPAIVKEVLLEIQKVFGELKVIWNDFTNCGVHHIQNKITKEITLDQNAFASKLVKISHPQLSTGKPEDIAVEELQALFMSLLGAVSYMAHTHDWMHKFSCVHCRDTIANQQ